MNKQSTSEELLETEIQEELKQAVVPTSSSITEDDLLMPEELPAKPLTVVERYVSELYALGKSSKQIASELGVPPKTVSRILAKPHIKEFVSQLINAQYAAIKEGRIRLINKIIEDKVAKIEEEHGGDFAEATKKDLVDLVVALDTMMKEREKAELGTGQDTYLQVINQVIKE